MNFVLSENARSLFGTYRGGHEEPVLIDASVDKLFELWQDSQQGHEFLNAPGGVEDPAKLDLAIAWVSVNDTVNAPVVDLGPESGRYLRFRDGRHTLIVLKGLGHKRIKVAVRENRAAELRKLLAG